MRARAAPLTHRLRGRGDPKPRPLRYNAAVAERYARALEAAVASMVAETDRELHTLHETVPAAAPVAMDISLASQTRILLNRLRRKFARAFTLLAPEAAGVLTKGVNAFSKYSVSESIGEVSSALTLRVSAITPAIAEAMSAVTTANVGLIKTIPQQYLASVEQSVMRNIQAGQGLKGILETVKATGAVTKKRAEFIAVDQNRKATTALNVARLKGLGVKKFEWLHSAGSKEPRPLHIAYSGRVFSLAHPPIIDEATGERGYPGQLINCRCTMVPVIDFED